MRECGNAGMRGYGRTNGLGKLLPPEAVLFRIPSSPRITPSPPDQCEYTTWLPSLMLSVTLPPAAIPVNWACNEGRLNCMDASSRS
jgi:hypothetical protein